MNLYSISSLINYTFVLVYGIILTFYFADIKIKNNIKLYVYTIFSFLLLQLLSFALLGEEILYKAFPLIIHLPLLLLLCVIKKKNFYISLIAVLSAYLFCTPRKWFGTLISFFWDYNPIVSAISEIIITIPLLILVVKFIVPYVVRLKDENSQVLHFFLIIPAIYYILEYAFTVYTDLLYSAGAIIVEFIDSAIVVLYFSFSVLFLHILYKKNEVDKEKTILGVVVKQSEFVIEELRKSEEKSAIYRHDLRHHINYINSCISQNQLSDASEYMSQIIADIDNSKPVRYSLNEPLNLILSSYINKAIKLGITTKINVTASNFDNFRIIDLCSLISNALENSIIACQKIENKENAFMNLNIYEKNNKLCINLCNSYAVSPQIVDGIPISNKKHHGIGTKSMISIVEKYHGIYRFLSQNGIFYFQATM